MGRMGWSGLQELGVVHVQMGKLKPRKAKRFSWASLIVVLHSS